MKKYFILFSLVITVFTLISCSSDEDKLFKAIKNGDLEEVKSLVEGGVSVLSSNSSGLTALEVARLNNQIEIAEYLYNITKKILDKETELLLKLKYPDDLSELNRMDKERIRYYELFSNQNETIQEYVSGDQRISEKLLNEHEKYFKIHQKIMKDFINAKVDIIEDILNDLIDKDFVSSIESRDARKIVNSKILDKLNRTE